MEVGGDNRRRAPNFNLQRNETIRTTTIIELNIIRYVRKNMTPTTKSTDVPLNGPRQIRRKNISTEKKKITFLPSFLPRLFFSVQPRLAATLIEEEEVSRKRARIDSQSRKKQYEN